MQGLSLIEGGKGGEGQASGDRQSRVGGAYEGQVSPGGVPDDDHWTGLTALWTDGRHSDGLCHIPDHRVRLAGDAPVLDQGGGETGRSQTPGR